MGSNRSRKQAEIAAFLAELERISAREPEGPIIVGRGLFSEPGSRPENKIKTNSKQEE